MSVYTLLFVQVKGWWLKLPEDEKENVSHGSDFFVRGLR